MPHTGRRSASRRLIMTLAALTAIIVGYYVGQHWQRRPLAGLSAVVYPAGQAVNYPAGLLTDFGTEAPWRLFLAADTRAGKCTQLLRHYALVFNRLAARPDIQDKLRLSLIAHDRPDAGKIADFTARASWVEVISAAPETLDRLSAELGIQPDPDAWCSAPTSNAVLVAPDKKRWALIPFEQAAIMARNIHTVIDFLE